MHELLRQFGRNLKFAAMLAIAFIAMAAVLIPTYFAPAFIFHLFFYSGERHILFSFLESNVWIVLQLIHSILYFIAAITIIEYYEDN